MSDEEDKAKKNGDSDFDKESRKAPLNPVNEDLFNFLDGLFSGEGDFPESIQIITAKGRNKDQHGSTIKQYLFKSGSAKPSRERVVMMCNEIIHRAQVETDTLKRETVFKIGAMHHGRSDDFYETMRLPMKPKKVWQRDENGSDSRFGGEDDDEDEMPPHVRYHTKFLEHIVQVNEQNRAFVEGYIDRTDRLVQFLTMDNDRLRMRNIEMFDVTERALSAEMERKQKVQWLETRNKASDMALGTVGQLLPHMVASFMPNRNGSANGQAPAPTEWQPGQDSPDATTLSEFFKIKGEEEGGKLTRQEFAFMIGTIENNQLQRNGVLTLEQAQTLLAVAAKKLTPDALDELLPGGQYEIKQEQVLKIIQGGIPPLLLTPINMLFELRKERKKHQAPPQGTPGSNAPSP